MNDGISLNKQELIRLRARAHHAANPPRRPSSHLNSGPYRSRLKGRGIDFDEVRAYQNGDDIRAMDWRVTARTGEPHIKLFHEERERPVFFVVDLGASMRFGTRKAFKSVQAGRLATLLAWAAAGHGDRVGAVVFAGAQRHEVTPQARERGVLQLIHTLLRVDGEPAPDHPGALYDALAGTARLAHPGGLIYLLSDFRQLDDAVETLLRRLRAHNELVVVPIYDALEKEPPPPGRYRVSDGNDSATFDSRSEALRSHYQALFVDRLQRLKRLGRQLAFPVWEIPTDDDPVDLLLRSRRP